MRYRVENKLVGCKLVCGKKDCLVSSIFMWIEICREIWIDFRSRFFSIAAEFYGILSMVSYLWYLIYGISKCIPNVFQMFWNEVFDIVLENRSFQKNFHDGKFHFFHASQISFTGSWTKTKKWSSARLQHRIIFFSIYDLICQKFLIFSLKLIIG